MENRTRIDVSTLDLPREIENIIRGVSVYDCSGHSGAQTLFALWDGGVYIKIAGAKALEKAAEMQDYFAGKGLSAPVVLYASGQRDYLVTRPVSGDDGTAEKYLSQPERLARVFGESLRLLHGVDCADCARRALEPLLREAAATYRQGFLDDIRLFIGEASAREAAREIDRNKGLLRADALIHGDYCLPNIMLDDWRLSGFIDVADGGLGDRHYDLALGLRTLNRNLKRLEYGHVFLDAYGRDLIDEGRLRLCGLLGAME